MSKNGKGGIRVFRFEGTRKQLERKEWTLVDAVDSEGWPRWDDVEVRVKEELEGFVVAEIVCTKL